MTGPSDRGEHGEGRPTRPTRPARPEGPEGPEGGPERAPEASGATAAGRDRDGSREASGSRPAPESGGFFPDLLRRGLTLGFTGFFMTEEAVRRALGDSVPRDVIEFILEQSERTRAELLDRFSREFGRVLNAVDPAEVARRLLEGHTVEVKASFRLVPDRRGGAPDRRGGVPDPRGGRGREAADAPPAEDEEEPGA